MENLNGALGFKATLDIDNFSVSAQAMENQIRHVSSTTQAEAADMENTLLQFAQRGASYLTTFLVGQGFAGVLQSIATTRGQFQQLEIAFETMLGSGTKAQALMNQMVETAAKTPFDLMGVAGGAKQLMAYGLAADKVNDTLIKLGNIASGLSIPLNDIVYLYGTTMVQGRLYTQDVRQFTGRGIPLVRELADMYGVTAEKINEMVTAGKIGFADVEKVLNKLTGAGGQFYNLMAKQSASLTGMISNLEDAWDSMLNEIGKQNQDLFAGAIGMASTLVENYDEIIRILKAVAIGYGSVKAGIVANTLATKGYTGVALIDNTVRATKIALLKADAAMTGKTKAQTELMTKADEAHVAALQAELTAEEQANLVKQLRISTIASLLTAQQQEYLSNLGLTTSSEGYEAAALGVLSVEQQEALKKTDLSSKSAIYKAALEQEVMAKKANRAATLESMRADVSAAAASVEAAKQRAIASTAAVEQARLDVYWAKASGSATAIAAAEKRLEAAVEQQSVTRKAALAAQSEFYAKKKVLEAVATRQSTTASAQDTVAMGAQTAATSILSAVTSKATLAVKTLWAAMKANPLGWILSIVGLVVSAITLFTGKTKEAKTAQGEFQDSTRKQTEELDTMMAVLEHTTEGTNSHKKAIDKINALCKEYNVTLLEENSTLEDQRKKYQELTKAIQENTAEKIKAKYTEQAAQDRSERDTEALEDLKKRTGKFKNYEVSEYGEGYWYSVKEIQGASDALFELIEADAKQAADKLRGLTGEEYTKTYNDLFNGMSKAFQAATGAADKDMNSYKSTLQKYFDEIVESAKTETGDVQKELSQIEQYTKKEQKVTVAVETDYTTLSFSDLDTQIKNTKKRIDELNKKTVKVEADNTELKELQELLDKLTGAKTKKQDNLNTESGISARIKELKDERSNVEINSTRYKELTKDIEKLTKKLPKTGEKGTDNQAALSQKQLEAERAVEEARISVMEEGYEKRKAIAALEHQRNLDRINKEEQELIEARRKAGKGGLSKAEKEGFEARRTAENEGFDKAQQSLFDGEIDYKKKQYELYFQWVQNVGKDVADKHFASLLQSGTSFTSWINSQIADLESKKAASPETFTEGDANALNQLKAEKDEMAGVKSSMDLFRESVQQTLNQASTLAEKIQAVADLKEKLASGGFNLNEDETAQAAYSLDEQDVQYQRELQNMVIEDFKSYEEKKNSITAQYAALRLTEQAQNNEALLERINKGEADALSELEVAQLQASADWQNLFQNLDTLTASQIQKLVDNLQEKLRSTNLKLAPADYKALIESLNQAKQRLVQLNPFKALGSSFSDYIAKLKELKQAQKKNLSDTEIQKYKAGVVSAAQEAASAIGAISQTTNSIGGTIAGIADSFGADGKTSAIIEGVSGALGGVGKAAGGAAKIMSGDLIGGITDVISGIGDFIISLNGMSDAMHEENIKELQEEIDSLADAYDDLGDAIERAYSTNKADLLEEQTENLRQQNEKIRKQIQEEEDKKKTDSERIKEWEEQIADNEKQIAENTKYNIIEAIMGTEVSSAIDDFATAYADAWANGEKAAKKSSETVKNIIKTAIIEQLKNKLQPEVESFMTYLAEALKDGVISESEEAMLDEYQRRLDQQQQDYLQKTGKWLKGDETQEDALTGAVRGMSEETGGLVAGRLNAVVINQSQQQSVLREQLAYQAQIAQNTADSARELREIKADLRDIKNRESSLLSQGIS